MASGTVIHGPTRGVAFALCAVLVSSAACTATEPPSDGATTSSGPTSSTASPTGATTSAGRLQVYQVPAGSHPHDVAPARDGGVWFTGQHAGFLGHLDPANGAVTQVPLGAGSRPHGVIVGADGAAWVTDGGLNAIVRVDGSTRAVKHYPLPPGRANANLNTATFDATGALWFTGQAGIYGRLDPATGEMRVYDAPRGTGPYGITTTPSGQVYYASLAGNHIARIDAATGAATVIEPPTAGQGARRVWSDSRGRIWVSEWNAGQVGVFDPQPASGGSGGCPATIRERTPFTSTTGTWCG